jgi:flagellar protein FliS
MAAYGYAQAYRDTAVLTASPGQLVLMLYEGALKSMAIAKAAFERPKSDFKRIEVINKHLIKAHRILAELQGNLNLAEGGDVAKNLHGLYGYHMRRLFEANMKKDIGPMLEAERLVRELRDAWAEMLSKREWAPERAVQEVA